MPEKTIQAQQLHKKSSNIWLTVFLLSILVTATAALIGSCLSAYAHKSDCIISLEDGVTGGEHMMSAQNLSTGSGSGSRTVGGKSANVHSTITTVELFRTSYNNASGEVTVQSANSDKIVAPGTDGKYVFTLANTGKRDADCKIWVDAEINFGFSELPIQIRMSGRNGWLIGDENTWKTASTLDTAGEREYLEAGSSAEYTIYWQWPFENGADEFDTMLGNLHSEQGNAFAANQDITYTVTIYTEATDADPQQNTGIHHSHKHSGSSEEESDSPVQPILSLISAKTGDDSQPLVWLGLIVIVIAGMGGWLYGRRHRDKTKN